MTDIEDIFRNFPPNIPEAASGVKRYDPFERIEKEFDLIKSRLASLEAQLPELKGEENG